MLGALSNKGPSHPWSSDAIVRSEAAGHTPNYAVMHGGYRRPPGKRLTNGRLPPPDLFYACDSQCARW